ncbi:MAG: hypothetical protein ACK4J0_00465 [Candidatus Anstonellaceae archaeon]
MAETKKPKSKSSKSNWKEKVWYSVKAPEIFEFKEIGQTISSDPENLKNRVFLVALSNLASSPSPTSIFSNIKLRAVAVNGNTISTAFIGHELLPSYVKSLIRRRRSLIQNVDDVVCADNKKMRLKSVCITQHKVSEQKKKDIRKLISTSLKEFAAATNFDSFCQEILFGKLAMKVSNKIQKISQLKRFEIKKSELFESF